MNAQSGARGLELVEGGARIGIGPQWLARAYAGSGHKALDRIDAGLASGSLTVILPDGATRLLGARAPGFAAEVVICEWRALLRLATGGSIGWYQAWEAGEWDSPDTTALFALFGANAATLGDAARAHGPWRWLARLLHRLHRNSRDGSQRNIHAHYDLGNDFYASWLDPTLSYSSACFATDAGTLLTAQRRKLDLIAARVAGSGSVLEVGCGWGALAARLHGAGMAVTAISLSDEQLAYARANQPSAIDFRKQDYRDVAGQYDAIVSVEMVEAVGQEYWPAWFDCIARNLKPGGRAAIQYISIRDELFDAYAASADFIQAYVFPGGMLVRESAFRALAAERGLEWTDQASFGTDYAETLCLWRENFDRAVAAGRLPTGFDQRFVKLWRYYLMYCEGGFRGGSINVAQVTLVSR